MLRSTNRFSPAMLCGLLLLVCGWLILFGIYGRTQETPVAKNTGDFKSWKITAFRSGGFVGMIHTVSLDSDGNLKQRDRMKETSKKVGESVVQKIGELLRQLDLPSAKLKRVRGEGGPDAFYSGFTITLDGKDFEIEGNSDRDTDYVELTAKQQETLLKLQRQFAEQQMDVPEWLRKLIDDELAAPLADPPAELTRYSYRNQTVYFLQRSCCDIPSKLFDESGKEICEPDGGLTGMGDGKCPDFFKERKDEKLILARPPKR